MKPINDKRLLLAILVLVSVVLVLTIGYLKAQPDFTSVDLYEDSEHLVRVYENGAIVIPTEPQDIREWDSLFCKWMLQNVVDQQWTPSFSSYAPNILVVYGPLTFNVTPKRVIVNDGHRQYERPIRLVDNALMQAI